MKYVHKEELKWIKTTRVHKDKLKDIDKCKLLLADIKHLFQ